MCKVEIDSKGRILNFASGQRKGGQEFTEEANILVTTLLMCTCSLKWKGGVKWWWVGEIRYNYRFGGLGGNCK